MSLERASRITRPEWPWGGGRLSSGIRKGRPSPAGGVPPPFLNFSVFDPARGRLQADSCNFARNVPGHLPPRIRQFPTEGRLSVRFDRTRLNAIALESALHEQGGSSMLKRLVRASAGVALAALLSSAAFAEVVYNRGNAADLETLDPHKTSTTYEAHIMRDLFEGLVMQDAKANLIPGAAESWTVSDDGLGLHLQDSRRRGLVERRSGHGAGFRLLVRPPAGPGDRGRIRLDALRRQERRGDQHGRDEARGDRRRRRSTTRRSRSHSTLRPRISSRC